MQITTFNITTKNLINKYNNSIYETYADEEDPAIILTGIYIAS